MTHMYDREDMVPRSLNEGFVMPGSDVAMVLVGGTYQPVAVEQVGWWESTLWRAVHVKYPIGEGKETWIGPSKLTLSGLGNWVADVQNRAWGAVVTAYTYENGRWRRGT
jgi:hypothetical protein